MTDTERAYHQKTIAALYRWLKTRDSWYKTARLWLERRALSGRIGQMKDRARREALASKNAAAIQKIEQQLRDMNPPLPEFKK